MPQSTAIMHLRLLLLTSLAYLASSSPISSPLQSTPIDPATMDYFTDINAIRNSPAVLAAIKAYQDGGNEVSIATCSNYDIASAKMPTVPGLPGPSDGLSPYHIALGVGVQNYSCASSTATPAAQGAVATLYNISCAAAMDSKYNSQLTTTAPPAAYDASKILSAGLPPHQMNNPLFNISGHHYFSGIFPNITPTFNLHASDDSPDYGVYFAKVDTKAPAAAMLGTQSTSRGGEAAVAWLKLDVPSTPPAPYQVLAADQKGVQEIFRVNTVGGNANATDCASHGDGTVFSVNYAAEYWFWA